MWKFGIVLLAAALAGCASTSSRPTSAEITAKYGGTHTVEDGLVVKRFQDGSGSVAMSDDVMAERWSIDCGIDAMTDKRDCNFYNKTGGIFVYYGNSATPLEVCVFGHDFPGRTGQIRVDSNPPLTTNRDGCVAASRVLAQLRAGSTVTTRRYDWPYDYPVDGTSSLAGFNKTLEVIAEIRAGG